MDPAVKQQAVERLRTASEILVTVSANPSIDQLAACIGTTLMLNKLGKHASAIFSGTVPSTLEFLQPEKTIEHDIDNLRDFIISLDKNKADKLHFKVEDNIVRIYITPYKTSLGEADLSYSQGDYNVEVVLALGVQNRTQVDAALAAHGRILHDATIVAVTAGAGKPSDLGQVNWQDTTASSLCEMMVSISESFGSGLIDAQMATAFLTGIVAETERFRNPKTTPKVMTMSAQLMAAGANQQLIASKLELDTPPQAATKPAPNGPKEGTIKVDHPEDLELPKPKQSAAPAPEVKTKIENAVEPAAAEPLKLDASSEINIDPEGNISTARGKFVPAPADFTPPATAEPLPPSNLPPAPPIPEDVPLPGEHTLLDPTHHQPTFDQSFSADTEPKWGATKPTPFSAEVGGEMSQADSVEAARAAVEQATQAAQSNQAPAELQKEQPTPAPAESPEQNRAPSAPPLPPPLPDSVIQGGQTDQT